ncbi:receptor-type tyrosine-protein phosphatase delta-like [Orbicella faveolata]|uniref:receptor-type tyrosine-protein phosphatase delta-like n=1 Tax=Orbicella faveolata TaxID=48498 RepID=UPI0009E1CEBD|nr:receptor-type tyrosine-protein phosphatase delta-like [Orbicella faveolata]
MITVGDQTFGQEIRHLRPYTYYQVQVAVKSYGITGPKSFAKVVQTLEDIPSAAPANIRSKGLDSTSLEISWDPPPPRHRNGRITNYTVKYREKGGRASFVNVDGIKSSIRLHNLKKYTTYFVWISASTSIGTGPTSSKHTFSTAEDVPSGAPRQLKFRVVNSSVIVVRWSEPLQQQDGRIQGYSVFYQKVDDQGNQLNPPPLPEVKYSESWDSLSVVLTELEAETTYQIEVAAYTVKGDGARSVPVLAKTLAKAPDAPYIFSTKPISTPSTGLTIKWRTSVSNVLSYKLRYGKSLQRLRGRDPPVKMKEMTFLPQTKEHPFRDLNPGVWYLFKVSTRTKAGWSPETSHWVEMPPGPPTGPPLQLRASPVSSTSIRVTWLEPDVWKKNGPLIGYSVLYNPLNRRGQSLVKNITNPNQTRVLLTRLRMFTDYEIRVRALGQKGPGPLSRPVIEKTNEDVPEACRELEVDNGGSDSVVLNWKPPVTDAGITKYQITYSGSKSYKENGEFKQLSHTREVKLDAVSPGLQSHTLQGLVPHTTYQIELSAFNSMGEGPKIALTLKTDKGRPPPLQRPVIIENELSDEFVPIELEPASERNGPISYYIVVVVPLRKSNQLPKDKIPDDFFKEVRRRRETTKRDIDEPYIAAKFSPSELPKRFNVGDRKFKNLYGYYNKELSEGAYYTMFTRAYVKNDKGEALYTSSPFVTPVKFGASNQDAVINTGARQDPEEHTGGGLNLIFVIIPVVAVVVITAIVVLAVLLCRRKKRRGKKSKSANEDKSEPSDPVEMKRMTIQTPAMMDHPPIPVSELAKHNSNLKADNNNKFSQEYKSIEPGETFTSDASTQVYNKSKNRYHNIFAFDHSRVRLATVDGIAGTDYINANFCDGYRKENAYIATQGPLEETIDDFWRMIWEYKTFTIVMLTELEENGRIKCAHYWPSEGTEQYGDIEVIVTDWIEFANYTITTFQVCKDGAPQPREVKHFQFTGWPDHDLPPHPTPFLAFLRRVRFYNPTDAGPIVVHCGGGVGRTACFIVIDSMLERVKHENTVDIYGHVTVLRTQRNFMVQKEEQYIFIHDALLEAVSCGNTEVHARNLLYHIKRLTEPCQGGMAGLAEEFRKLNNPSQARRQKQGAGGLAISRSKERLANILPHDTTRVQLLSTRGIEGSSSINASSIDGYRQRGAYIATQDPSPDTVDDFWGMLMEQNSNIVVMLTQLDEEDRDHCYKYWPTDRSAKHQYYVVDPVTEQDFPNFVIRDFKVKDIMSGTVRNIKQFHFYGWTDSIPKSGEGILDLIGQVQRTYEQQEEEGPITVHCSDGIGRTGVFCALCIVLERMRSEGVVDLFQTVKLLRTQRPNMIQNQEQYLFCYQKALEYLSSFDHYAV